MGYHGMPWPSKQAKKTRNTYHIPFKSKENLEKDTGKDMEAPLEREREREDFFQPFFFNQLNSSGEIFLL